MRPRIFVSRTREKLGRTLEPCSGDLDKCKYQSKVLLKLIISQSLEKLIVCL